MILSRWWPDGITWRLALLFIVLIGGGSCAYWWFYGHEHERRSLEHLADIVVNRITAVTTLIAQRPAGEHRIILNAVTSRDFRVHLAKRSPPSPAVEKKWPFITPFYDVLTESLARVNAPVKEITPAHFTPLSSAPQPHGEQSWSRRQWIRVVIQQRNADDRADHKEDLIFHIALNHHTGSAPMRRFFGLLIFAFILVGLMIWGAHRETKPLRRFAAAAERLGLDVDASPLAREGSRELRSAIEAFNRMQMRLQRFISDRTQMLMAISHDLRTPLTRLRLRVEFINSSEQQKKAITDIDEMGDMITEALDFACNDARTESRESVDIAVLLKELSEDIAAVTPGQIRMVYAGPSSLWYHCQPVGMRRALSNLMDNAAHYGGNAQVNLAEHENEICIIIDDDGPGIPVSQREQVFAPFYRLEASRNRETGGVGLGLSLARATVRKHGGDIVLNSRESQHGLSVQVTLPIISMP